MAPRRRAICVGINQYKNFPEATLNGCVNDAQEMASILKTHLGFAQQDITLLTDSKATKSAIMGALREAVAGAARGQYGYVVFSMASHGTQVPDTTGQEPDGLSEAFCPHDLSWNDSTNQWEGTIIDDELRRLFQALPPRVLLEAYLDTCHSGTGLRALASPGALQAPSLRKGRYLPPRGSRVGATPTPPASSKRPLGIARIFMKHRMNHHILWAGCAAEQLSEEDWFNGVAHGAFTYYFSKEMRANPRLPRSELMKRIRADLVAGSPPFLQVPQLETNATGSGVGPR